jgi:hypothetical protein
VVANCAGAVTTQHVQDVPPARTLATRCELHVPD